MTRISKQAERRMKSPRKRHYRIPALTGPKKDALPEGYRPHPNVAPSNMNIFVPKVG